METKIMMYLFTIIVVTFIVNKCKKAHKRISAISTFNSVENDFIKKYYIYEKAIKDNLDGEDILRKLNLSNNFIQIRGMKKPLNFQNSSDLRKIFLFCGEVIIIYSDELEETYDYYAQDYADFDMILAILKNIRICCMEYGENTNVEISIK